MYEPSCLGIIYGLETPMELNKVVQSPFDRVTIAGQVSFTSIATPERNPARRIRVVPFCKPD